MTTVTISTTLLTKLLNAAIEREHALIAEGEELDEDTQEWVEVQVERAELGDAIEEATSLRNNADALDELNQERASREENA